MVQWVEDLALSLEQVGWLLWVGPKINETTLRLKYHKKTLTGFFGGVTSAAYASSQARSRIGGTGAGLCHSNSNSGSEPHLGSIPQLMAMPDT